MTADADMARELAALHEELSAPLRASSAAPVEREAAAEKKAASGPKAEPHQGEAAAEEREAAEQLHDFINLMKEFIEGAEHNIAEHPTASVIGALLVGILIGRLLGRR